MPGHMRRNMARGSAGSADREREYPGLSDMSGESYRIGGYLFAIGSGVFVGNPLCPFVLCGGCVIFRPGGYVRLAYGLCRTGSAIKYGDIFVK